MKSEIFLRKYGPFVPEPGMLWNLDIFGKFAFEIFLVRVDYWYLWKTHFLNFRDFQESPNPLKIHIFLKVYIEIHIHQGTYANHGSKIHIRRCVHLDYEAKNHVVQGCISDVHLNASQWNLYPTFFCWNAN